MTRYEELKSYLKQYKKVIVAFSGGIDSYFVLKSAIDSLGKNNVLAVTGDSPSLKNSEKNEVSELARVIDANHKIIFTGELDNPDYFNNPQNRCFFCKTELYQKLNRLKNESGYNAILDGTNYDDMSDYRPGYKASKNNDIVSPLVDLKFSKKEIREISKGLGLQIWDKPSSPCLSSRIPYGQKVTVEKLSLIERAEDIIKQRGFKEFRVRHFEFDTNESPGIIPGNIKKLKLAKIDISKNEMEKILNTGLIDELNTNLKEAGYDFVTIDLGGLKSGSLNVNIKIPVLHKN
jgi:uncharacterized protein